jgi:hypothetical protein
MDLKEIGRRGVDCIGVVQDKEKCGALLTVVMKFGYNKMLEKNRVATQLVGSRVVLSSIELIS